MALNLVIVTLNVWGIPYISSDQKIRISAIAEELAKGQFDFVSLQEVWSESDYQYIKDKTSSIFPHTYYFYSGVFGSGLCLFSKYPIISTFFHPWSVNGYVHRIQHADWFGGKGVGLCKVLVNNQIINIYVAHLHAAYDDENDEYKAHRVIQAFDTAQFIENTRNDAILQILAGDLNTEPGDISYKILTRSSKMTDCCDDDTVGTSECKRNSYTTPSDGKQNPVGKRIDHILIRPAKNYKATVSEYSLPLPDRVPGYSFSFSDHEAVCAKIKIEKKPESIGNYCDANLCDDEIKTHHDKSNKDEALKECISICNASLEQLKKDRIIYYSMALFLGCFLLAVMDIIPPYGLQMLYLMLKFVLCGIILFFAFMATLWNTMERHGILSGKLSMEVSLNLLEKYD